MSKLEEMQTSIENLKKQVDDALLFADDVKTAIKSNGVEVADGTPVSEYAEKIEGLYEAGRQAEYDEFWDAFQYNGTRTHYAYGFSGRGWNKSTFKPKYKIAPIEAHYIFNQSLIEGDLTQICQLDTSNTTTLAYAFNNTFYLSKLGVIDLSKISNASDLQYLFYNSQVKTIEKIIMPKADITSNVAGMFDAMPQLKDIIIEGSIKFNFNTQNSPLSKESIISFINALDLTVTNKTASFNQSAVNSTFETSEGLNDGSTSQEWLDLTATKPNWSISLVDG